jgi:hypothetical protein
MKQLKSQIDRLLSSAASAQVGQIASPPFGFETRVVALWRAGAVNGVMNGIGRFVRRVAFAAVAVIVLASAASIWEFRETLDMNEPQTNEFAIADSAIQNEF